MEDEEELDEKEWDGKEQDEKELDGRIKAELRENSRKEEREIRQRS